MPNNALHNMVLQIHQDYQVRAVTPFPANNEQTGIEHSDGIGYRPAWVMLSLRRVRSPLETAAYCAKSAVHSGTWRFALRTVRHRSTSGGRQMPLHFRHPPRL